MFLQKMSGGGGLSLFEKYIEIFKQKTKQLSLFEKFIQYKFFLECNKKKDNSCDVQSNEPIQTEVVLGTFDVDKILTTEFTWDHFDANKEKINDVYKCISKQIMNTLVVKLKDKYFRTKTHVNKKRGVDFYTKIYSDDYNTITYYYVKNEKYDDIIKSIQEKEQELKTKENSILTSIHVQENSENTRQHGSQKNITAQKPLGKSEKLKEKVIQHIKEDSNNTIVFDDKDYTIDTNDAKEYRELLNQKKSLEKQKENIEEKRTNNYESDVLLEDFINKKIVNIVENYPTHNTDFITFDNLIGSNAKAPDECNASQPLLRYCELVF